MEPNSRRATAQDSVRAGVGVEDTEAAYTVSVISKLLEKGGDQISQGKAGTRTFT